MWECGAQVFILFFCSHRQLRSILDKTHSIIIWRGILREWSLGTWIFTLKKTTAYTYVSRKWITSCILWGAMRVIFSPNLHVAQPPNFAYSDGILSEKEYLWSQFRSKSCIVFDVINSHDFHAMHVLFMNSSALLFLQPVLQNPFWNGKNSKRLSWLFIRRWMGRLLSDLELLA